VIPPKQSARLVWRMEEVLDLYEEPYEEKRPVLCFDERPCQLLADLREPLPHAAGRPERRDHESTRGEAWPTCSWPSSLSRVGEAYRLASVGVDASSPSSLATWPRIYTPRPRRYAWWWTTSTHPQRGLLLRGLRRRASTPTQQEEIEFCYTPVHGSWLNMAEIEISVLVRQCLGGRRIPEAEILRREARAWCEERNRLGASVDWRFTTADARTKLRRLYPSIER
jgi:hypothetical protein